ncbi:MAG: hypothetical protein K9H62_12440 [Bacteroidales bacterium]|nr:hypothetical protein [Bacteroidales bacterium]
MLKGMFLGSNQEAYGNIYWGYRTQVQGSVLTESIVIGATDPDQMDLFVGPDNNVNFPDVLECAWKDHFLLATFDLFYMWVCVSVDDANGYNYQQNIDDESDKGLLTTIFTMSDKFSIAGGDYRMYMRALYAPQNLRLGYNSF